MDFDAIASDSDVSFEGMLRAAKADILKTVTTGAAVDWGALADRYEAFKDVSKEARKRGELLGPVLVVAERLVGELASREVADGASSPSPSPALGSCTPAEHVALVALARLYRDLYTASPVPTELAWRGAVRAAFAEEAARAALASLRDDSKLARLAYVSALHRVAPSSAGSAECAEEGEDAFTPIDGDDGTFVENAFKEFLRRVLAVGRKRTRAAGSSVTAADVRILSDYLHGGTVEW